MAHSNDPIWAQGVFTAQKTLTAAKTTLSGVTDATELFAAPSTEGCIVTRIWAFPKATLAADTRVDIYLSPDGSAATLVDNELVQDVTISATTVIPETSFPRWSEADPLYVGPGERLYAGLSAAFASGMVVCVQYQKLTAAAVA